MAINFVRLLNFKNDLLYPLKDTNLADINDSLTVYGLLLLAVYHKQETLIESCIEIIRSKFIFVFKSRNSNDVTFNKYIISDILRHLSCPEKGFKDISTYINSELNYINPDKLDLIKDFFMNGTQIASEYRIMIANLLADIHEH